MLTVIVGEIGIHSLSDGGVATHIDLAMLGLSGAVISWLNHQMTRAQHALRLTTSNLTAVFESMSEAYLSVDTQWRLTQVNTAWETFTGKTSEEALGKSLWEILPPSVSQQIGAAFRVCMTERRDVYFKLCSPESKRWVEVHCLPD